MTIATHLHKMMHEISLFYRWSISDDVKIELARQSKMMVWTLRMIDKGVAFLPKPHYKTYQNNGIPQCPDAKEHYLFGNIPIQTKEFNHVDQHRCDNQPKDILVNPSKKRSNSLYYGFQKILKVFPETIFRTHNSTSLIRSSIRRLTTKCKQYPEICWVE